MRQYIGKLLTAALLLTAAAAPAQIDAGLVLAQPRLLEFEMVSATVTVRNLTGEPIRLGESNATAKLNFEVEFVPGELVSRLPAPLMDKPVEIAPGAVAQVALDLLPSYAIRKCGPYAVNARIDWKDRSFRSPRIQFDVLPGLEIERQDVAVPGLPDVRRSLRLRVLDRKQQSHLFLRIEQADGDTVYACFDLGAVVRVRPPVMAVDAKAQVHVLHQSGPMRFTHTVATVDGVPKEQNFLTATAASANLAVEADGRVIAVGVEPYRGDAYVPALQVEPPRSLEEARGKKKEKKKTTFP